MREGCDYGEEAAYCRGLPLPEGKEGGGTGPASRPLPPGAHLVAVQHCLDDGAEDGGGARLTQRRSLAHEVQQAAPRAQLLHQEDGVGRLVHVLRQARQDKA